MRLAEGDGVHLGEQQHPAEAGSGTVGVEKRTRKMVKRPTANRRSEPADAH